MADDADGDLDRRRAVGDVMRHDMRTAVGIGRGYLTMLLNHYDALSPEQRAKVVGGVGKAFDRLDEFSRRVLVDEKLLVHDEPVQCGDVDVAAFVGELRAAFPSVEVEVAPDLPASVRLDPVMVREALENLVANALTAAPPGTTVRLAVCGRPDLVRFEVRDEGDGITEADRAVLFRRFGRTERSLREQSAGMGLGLSIVRRVVEAHRGTYGVTTDDGTVFWVELPVSPEGVPSPTRHAEDPHP